MKSILHIITTINRGGAENQLLALASSQIANGDQVQIVALDGEDELKQDFERVGISVYTSLNKRAFGIQIAKLYTLLRCIKPDVIHAHLPRAELLAALLPISTPLVVSRHNSEEFYPGAPKLISRLISRAVCVRAKKIIFISQGAKDYAIAEKEVVPSEKINVIYYGIHRDSDSTLGQNVKRVVRERTRFLTVGRLVRQKDILTQVKAIKRLFDRDIELIIVGQGELRDELESFVAKHRLGERVKFVGRTNRVRDELRNSDCFILSSRYEGFGLVLLEAALNRIPIIASDIPTTREILGDKFPYLFKVGDDEALAKLMQKFLDQKNYDFINYDQVLSRFSIENSMKQIDQLYCQVLGIKNRD